jgi:heme/copper-type cytochrome/quinol oxidase subunit 2
MKHRGLLTFFIGLQVALVAIALSPALVTFAELPPSGVSCSTCSSAEVQIALIRAAAVGRAQIQQLVFSQVWVLVGIALLAIGVAVRLAILSRERKNGGTTEGVSNAL